MPLALRPGFKLSFKTNFKLSIGLKPDLASFRLSFGLKC